MLTQGIDIILENEKEGWFPLAPSSGLRGKVIRTIPVDPPQVPFYLIQLNSPLEIQEPAKDTPSGLRLQLYSHLVVRSRWVGIPLGSKPSISAQVFLVPI